MDKIYKSQAVTIRLVTNLDISAATNKIKVKSPSGSVTTHNSPTLTGKYTLSQKTTLGEVGVWTFWIYSTWGSDVIPSTPATLTVYEEGT